MNRQLKHKEYERALFTYKFLFLALIILLCQHRVIGQSLNLNEGFEGSGTKIPSIWRHSGNGLAHRTTERAKEGSKSLKFEVRATKNDDFRDEVVFNGGPLREMKYGSEWWYGFSLYVPSNWKSDPVGDIIWQSHRVPDAHDVAGGNPPQRIAVIGNKMVFREVWSGQDPLVDRTKFTIDESQAIIDNIQPGKWYDFVLHFKWSKQDNNSGLSEIWVDGVKKYRRVGPNAWDDQKGLYVKFGIYKSLWRGKYNGKYTSQSLAKGITSRVYYHDNMRIYLGPNGYNLVKPDGSSTPTGNSFPVANINATPQNGTAPLNVQFDGSNSYDPDGNIIGYFWEFGDGGTSTNEAPSHQYLNPGNYTASLTVTDNQSSTSTSTTSINTTGTVVTDDHLRINAGGANYTMQNGTAFYSDDYYSANSNLVNSSLDIAGTADDNLYQNHRSGTDFAYDIPVENGNYNVVLHFATLNDKPVGAAIFDIDIEQGAAKKEDFDIREVANSMEATTLTFENVPINDGKASINFLASKGYAKVSGIELIRLNMTSTASGLRINTGGAAFSSSAGNDFDADINFNGDGSQVSNAISIAGTNDQELYQSHRSGQDFGYEIPVSNGNYEVILHFATLNVKNVGDAVFDIDIENGAAGQTNFDIRANAASMEAHQMSFPSVAVNDGAMSLHFQASTGFAKVSGIELIPISGSVQSTLTATDDAWVKQAGPGDNYGADNDMRVKDAGNYSQYAYVQFDATGISNASSATLRLFPSSSSATIIVDVYGTGTGWNQSNLTYGSIPTTHTAKLGSFSMQNVTDAVEIDVSDYVNAELSNGASQLSFRIASGNGDNSIGRFDSQEGGSPAELIINSGTSAANIPPNVDFTASVDSGYVPLQVSFDASMSSDPDGSIVSYAWELGDGEEPTGTSFSHTFDQPGTYTVKLVATDDQGAKGSHAVEIKVKDNPITDVTVASSNDGWVKQADPGENNGSSTELRIKEAGNYSQFSYVQFSPSGISNVQSATLRLHPTSSSDAVIVDAYGTAAGWDQASLTYGNIPNTTTAKLGSGIMQNNTDPVDIDVSNFVITEIAGGNNQLSFRIASGNNDNSIGRFGTSESGNPVELLITYGGSGNHAPTAICTSSKTTAAPNESITFDASDSNDPDGSIVSHNWDFGDGKTSTDIIASHDFDAIGTYEVKLIVIDDKGFSDEMREAINIIDTPPSGELCNQSPANTLTEIARPTPDENHNFIQVQTYRKAIDNANIDPTGINQWASIAYFDGLGRPIQSMDVGASPLGQDVVSINVYDQFGREPKQYLPFNKAGGGDYHSNTLDKQENFYNAMLGSTIDGSSQDNKSHALAETRFEASPLNRVLEQGAPGYDWQLGRNTITNAYKVNTQAISGGGKSYPAGELSIVETIDENGGISRIYTDKLGRTILSEAQIEGNDFAQTWYTYDDFGNVTNVIQPEGEGTISDEFTFKYEYDERQLISRKRIPGHDGWTTIHYDELDRVIATVDPNGNILVTNYDQFSRPIATGMGTTTGTINSWHSHTFYDSYGKFPDAMVDSEDYEASQNVPRLDVIKPFLEENDGIPIPNFGPHNLSISAPETSVQGMVTGVLLKVFDLNPSASGLPQDLLTVTYYDEYGRELQTRADNALGYEDISTNFYNFSGDLLAKVLIHNHGESNQVIVKKVYEYDHRSRLRRITMQVNDQDPVIINESSYNELGQLANKKLELQDCNTALQQVDYKYNYRGWMTQINDPNNLGDDLFGMNLHYNQNLGWSGNLYNGNIAAMEWRTGLDDYTRGYGFDYDKLNRLKVAAYKEKNGSNWNRHEDRYNVNLTYHKNGNIHTLKRSGLNQDETFGGLGNLMDNLNYNYSGNRLMGITENGSSGHLSGLDHFEGSSNYGYDANGNMTTDSQRDMVVGYLHFNKPYLVMMENGAEHISWNYTADGTKIRETISTGDVHTYVGSFFYKNGILQHFSHEEGRVLQNGDSFDFQYNLSDHLGNVRLSFEDANGDGQIEEAQNEILQVDHYYPYGMRMGGLSMTNGTENRYRYNGKELHTEMDLGWYDYGARMYNPSVGRWNGVDALSESYLSFSPYNYVANNPVILVDPDGNNITTSKIVQNAWNGTPEDGNVTWQVPNFSSTEGGDPDPVELYREAYNNVFGEGNKREDMSPQMTKATKQIKYFFTHSVGNVDENLSLELQAIVLMALMGDNPQKALYAIKQIQKSDSYLYRWTTYDILGTLSTLGAGGSANYLGKAGFREFFRKKTVWSFIRGTQPPLVGGIIPKSFTMLTETGKFWVAPNATKHMYELIRNVSTSHGQLLIQQAMLSSFHRAVSVATKQGIKYEEMIKIGGWELIFSVPRQKGLSTVIKHALYKP